MGPFSVIVIVYYDFFCASELCSFSCIILFYIVSIAHDSILGFEASAA